MSPSPALSEPMFAVKLVRTKKKGPTVLRRAPSAREFRALEQGAAKFILMGKHCGPVKAMMAIVAARLRE